MPKVGDKHFDYTPEGVAKAKKYAEATGENVKSAYKKGGKVKKPTRKPLPMKPKWEKDPLTGKMVKVKPKISKGPHRPHIPKDRWDRPTGPRKLEEGGYIGADEEHERRKKGLHMATSKPELKAKPELKPRQASRRKKKGKWWKKLLKGAAGLSIGGALGGKLGLFEDGGKLEGKLKGPSHKKGGIKFKVKGQVQEAEGGEFVIKKDAVKTIEKKYGKNFLDELNGIPSNDARNRKKVTNI